MSSPSSLSTWSPADEAAWLKTLFAERGSLAPDAVQPDLNEAVARWSVAHLVTVAETMDLPLGSLELVTIYKTWIEVNGGHGNGAFAVWFNLGIQYGAAGDPQNQIACYTNALAIKPDLYQAAVNLGLAHEAAGNGQLALAIWQKAVQPKEARTALLNHIGRYLENAKRLTEAEHTYRESLLADPMQPDVLHHWIGLRTRMCLWPIYDRSLPGVTLEAMSAATRALTLLALRDDIAIQTEGNRAWIAEKMPPAPEQLSDRSTYGHQRLRIGYMSSDFCRHPIAYLVAELFELHDRRHFEVYGYCSTKDDGSDVRQRILAAFDVHVDIGAMTDEQAARRIRQDEIDILVDLNGLTLGTRLQVMRWRPAPHQITYLGYNGPVPLPELDHIIADEYVIPQEAAHAYEPAPLFLPLCFQVNDSKLPVAAPSTRREVGLPEGAFVFCSFSNTYKISETMFDSWMVILQRVEDAVLWLYVDNAFAIENLTARARRANIAEHRLIFAGRIEPAQYRARLALADLFLDTSPYNAGTTASDALRVGLPLITLSGQSYISRMAGSLLSAMGLGDGIASDLNAYVDLAVSLASDRPRYEAYRARVKPELWTQTLGNTERFCRDLETAFQNLCSASHRVVPSPS